MSVEKLEANSKPLEEALAESAKLEELADGFDPENARRLKEEREGSKETTDEIKNLGNFYKIVQNPLNNDDALNAMIGAFAKRRYLGSSSRFYAALQDIGSEDKVANYYNIEDSNKYEERMYERWRNSVVNMRKAQYDATPELKSDFVALRNYVKQHPEIKTSRELYRAYIVDAEDEDKADDALEKYSWRLKDGWWEHVKSRYVNARQESRIDVDHRLYLNPDSTYTHAIVNAMVDKYEEKGVPYYFKFSPSGDRADTIVIYSSTKDLLNNLNIVRQVKKEHPEFVKHMHRPPILTGVIEDNIGYGAEPEDKSYSEDRADILYSAIKGASLDWVAKHQNDIIDYKGKQVPFSEFIIGKEMVAVAEELNSHYNYHNKYDREAAERKNPGNVDEIALQQEITKSVGCDADDLKEDSKMYRYFKSVVRSNFSNIVDSLQKTGKCDLSVKLKNDKKLALGGDYFVCAIAKAAPDIAKHDHAFLNDIRSRVRKGCIEHQIDSDKFVFDNSTVQKMAKEGNG